uniref:Uncharacterized protein n=1 Tax=viral metagenome TaxID=1070528 RepID=A0A6C0B8J1_9ZZZZ
MDRLSKEQLANEIKDLVDNLNASRIVRDATITEPGGLPTANARAEYAQQESVITPQLIQYMNLFLDPHRVVRNNVEGDSFNRGGRRKKSRRSKK